MEALTVNNIEYKANGKILLDNVSFTLPKNSMLAVIGANGAGKSTLIKLLCKELEPSAGHIHIHGKALVNYTISELAGFRSVLNQHNTLSISFRVDELVMMGRYPHFKHQPTDKDHNIVRAALKETGMEAYSRRDYNTLSGGEQQRVQLARVIAQIYEQQNALLFLDEPTNGLDLLYQQHILQLASAMTQKSCTVVSILHDINFASQYADYILLLKNGKTVAFGEPNEVITEEHIETAFQVRIKKIDDVDYKHPLVFPISTLLTNK
ncbi:heme ABC transporter ATP-binding protein [Sphingobacterium sp. UT-1RO-CII-1]|uniref:heme ABC transporter ATP-binding protein n=1 Tax=Sphingobacterium sp. UT-1RO-CII-1 TaxID=2995225 RepID=UPI00227C8D34|nr:heme ABC transporter ATP-binding protein [Sphingobacterium sp. UT-1RO-CII-1]MCY4779786.1 heme ABC transporter ATP-binding protein [Sphingobacterium sp. UT-1RO-CII-1]